MKYDKMLEDNWNYFARRNAIKSIITNFEGTEEEFYKLGEEEVKYIIDNKVLINTTKCSLDFGCGIGRLTKPLAKYFDISIGVDISEEMVEIAKRNSRINEVYLVCKESNLIPLANESVDFILSLQVLQHIPRIYKLNILKEFYRILKPNGQIYFEHPFKGEEAKHTKNRMHMDIWKVSDFRSSLMEIGFKVQNVESLGRKDTWPRASYTLSK